MYGKKRKEAGCHLLFNVFWMVPHFCIHFMCMRDTMHQIDLGVIIAFFKAILRKYQECIENVLNIPGKAAKKLTTRLQLMLRKYTSSTAHKISGKHACMLPVTYGTSMVFMRFRRIKRLLDITGPLITDIYFWLCHFF